MDYITRVSYNRAGWRKPTGDARDYEHKRSYNHRFGFGHEDWLFRNEWQADGWRYGFLQGVGKSLKKLRKADKAFDVRLFCIEPGGKRRYVADMGSVECLSEEHAKNALQMFRRNGWLRTMKAEVKAIKGKVEALGDANYATHILNIRFRPENVRLYAKAVYAGESDPVHFFSRYTLVDVAGARRRFFKSNKNDRPGTDLPPSLKPIIRQHSAASIEIERIHSKMQKKLMELLQRRHPKAEVRREANYVDVVMRTSTELVLYEIKSCLSAVSAIRQAIGQLLEYLYYAGHRTEESIRLVIVGRSALSGDELSYFDWLKSNLGVRLDYQVVEI